jgi:hypothetical protein
MRDASVESVVVGGRGGARDLVPQDEELDILGRGHATRQQDQLEHLPEDQVKQQQRYAGIVSDQRSPLVTDPSPTCGTPQVATAR